jgi:uncharacterized protein YlxW (UPF0749 family)
MEPQKTLLQRKLLEIYNSDPLRITTDSRVVNKVLFAVNSTLRECQRTTKEAEEEAASVPNLRKKNNRLQDQVNSLLIEREKHSLELVKLRAADVEWRKLVENCSIICRPIRECLPTILPFLPT